MTAVMLLGDFPVLDLFSQPGRLTTVNTMPGIAGVDALYEHVVTELEEYGTVLALYPTWSGTPHADQLALVRSALETGHVLPVPVDLPPLALAVLGAQLASAAARLVDAGSLVAAAPELGRRLVVGAWVSRPGRRIRGARLRDRLLSVLPWTRFAVTLQPTGASAYLGSDAGPPEPWLTNEPSVLVVAGRSQDSTWATNAVPTALSPENTVRVEPIKGAAQWWGARRTAEIVVSPAYPARLAVDVLSGYPTRTCTWCDELMAGHRCPYCSMTSDLPLPAVAADRSLS